MFKFIYIVVFSLFFTHSISGQCLIDRHSSTWFDGWISCDILVKNPNEVRGETHWIEYDLGSDYYLYEMQVWNMNAPDILDYGLKNVYIDYSTDGISWTEYGQYTFTQAPGQNNFEGIEEMTFDGTKARYVLISAIDNYGGDCYGLSEISIRAREMCPEEYVAWIGEDGDWNVASNWCNNQIPTDQDKVWIPPGKNVIVPIDYIAEALRLDMANNASVEVLGQLFVAEN